LGIVRAVGQLSELEQVVRSPDQRAPGRDLVAQALGAAQDLLGRALVSPEIRGAGLLVECV